MKVRGNAEAVREIDGQLRDDAGIDWAKTGRDPYNRNMMEPYEP